MRRIIAAVTAVILLFTACFALYYIKSSNGIGKTVTAVEKTFEKSAETEGFIVKNEKVIDLSGGEFARFYFKSGDKVSGGAKVASLYNSESDGALISEIEKIDERIKNLGSDYVNLTANDVLKVENYIDSDLDKIQSVMESGNAASETLLKDRLTALFNIKHTNSAPENDDEAALKREKQALEAKLSSAKSDILSPMGGIFSEKADGFEGLMTEEKARAVTVSEVGSLLSEKEKDVKRAAKIIDNYKWFIVCCVPEKTVSGKNEGDKVKLEMPAGEVISGVIEHISEPEDGKCALTVSSDRDFSSLADARKVKIKIIFESYKGFVIPTKAFHIYNGEYGVFVRKNSKKIFKKTEVIYSDDEYSVVSKSSETELKLYDAVITDGDLSEYYDS